MEQLFGGKVIQWTPSLGGLRPPKPPCFPGGLRPQTPRPIGDEICMYYDHSTCIAGGAGAARPRFAGGLGAARPQFAGGFGGRHAPQFQKKKQILDTKVWKKFACFGRNNYLFVLFGGQYSNQWLGLPQAIMSSDRQSAM